MKTSDVDKVIAIRNQLRDIDSIVKRYENFPAAVNGEKTLVLTGSGYLNPEAMDRAGEFLLNEFRRARSRLVDDLYELGAEYDA